MSKGSLLTARLYAILFAAELFGFPLASTIPVFTGLVSRSRPISIAYRVLIVGLTLLLLWRAWRERWPWLKGLFAYAGALLAFMLLARLVWDCTFVDIPLDMPWDDQWTYIFGVTALPLLAFLMVPDYKYFEMLQRYARWIGCITLLVVVAASLYTVGDIRNFGGRLQTDILNPISLGQMGICCFITVNAQRATAASGKSRGFWRRSMRTSMLLISVLSVIASVSKGPILALAAVIALSVLFRGHAEASAKSIVFRLIVLAVVLSAALGLLIVLETYTPIRVLSRFLYAGSDSSTSTRLELIEGALTQFGESPILGSAYLEYESRFYPHNIIIEVLMTNGVLGFAALVVFLFGCFYQAARMIVSIPQDRWIALVFIQFFIVSMFSGSLYYDSGNWAAALLVLACGQASIMARRSAAAKVEGAHVEDFASPGIQNAG